MPLSPGTRLGPYEISSPLGAGGMGEVYRARDTRLERNVAIKILPAELASSAQFKLRFEREAKTISQLNHPHICTLYDVGENYLVMELLEGETLGDRLSAGPMSTEEVLRYGIEIAEALDKAHRQGIIHRDLKPSNVMLTKTGAKLLDFGLAKAAAPLVDFSGATQHKPLTQEGTIVGTFQYMSPEQLEGVEADPRTDIFALGALLYEMATGKRAFEGKTRTSLIAAIVSGRPTPVSQIQPLAPPALEHVIERCLEKDPADRWQSAHDVAEELKWVRSKGSQAGIAAPVAARRRTRERLSWMLHLITAAAAVGLTWGVIELRREPARMFVSSILPPAKTDFAFVTNGAPALSPDGKRITFVAGPSTGPRMLYVRALSGNAAQPLAGTEEATFPFWSPDSRSIAFFADGKLKKIDAAGGPAQALADAPAGRGGSWSSRGLIVFAPYLSGSIFKVSDAGGATESVTKVDPKHGETTHRWPSFLPDGRHFLFMTSKSGTTDRSSFVGSIDGDLQKQLVNANSNAVYSPQGYLLYMLDRALVAQSFDPKSLTVGRDAVPIAEVVAYGGRWDAFFSVSNNGVLAYQPGTGIELSQLLWFDDHGKAVGSVGKQADYQNLSLSHDGRRVAITLVDPATRHWDLWVNDLSRGTFTRLTFDPMNEWWPIWSPDDSMILYTSNARSAGEMMMKRSSGTGAEESVYGHSVFTVASDWSPDGKTILFHEQGGPGSNTWDLWLYSLQEHKARAFLQTPYIECCGKFSPDGRWVVYQSNEASGKFQIFVLPVSGNAGKWMISTDGGTRAHWSRDGKRIYYSSPDNKLMAVDVNARNDEFTAGVPQVLFPFNPKSIFGEQYDVSADGKRFLINSPMQQGEVAPITIVQNWTAALKK